MIEMLENRRLLSSTVAVDNSPLIEPAADSQAGSYVDSTISEDLAAAGETAADAVVVVETASEVEDSTDDLQDESRLGDLPEDFEFIEEWQKFYLYNPIPDSDLGVYRERNGSVTVELAVTWCHGGIFGDFTDLRRTGNNFSVTFEGNVWTGVCTFALVDEYNSLDLGWLEDGDYSVTITSGENTLATLKFNVHDGWDGYRIPPIRYSPEARMEAWIEAIKSESAPSPDLFSDEPTLKPEEADAGAEPHVLCEDDYVCSVDDDPLATQ